MNPPDGSALERLLALPRFGSGPGLHRALSLAEPALQTDWAARLRTLRITGSKGKGSVSAIATAILQALERSVGLFTSPHLFRFNERIQLNREPISDESLARAAATTSQRVEAYASRHPHDSIGVFEAIFALALHHFADTRPDTLVAEVGIGGRYDPVRLLPGDVVALTSVELEHTAILGKTTDLIAYDKADLCPRGGTLIAAPLEPDLARRLKGYCTARGVHMESLDPNAVTELAYSDGRMQFTLRLDGLDFGPLDTPLLGEHQARNAALAILAVRRWARHAIAPDTWRRAVRDALSGVRWPGRLETVSTDPTIIIDVGHTPASMRAVARTIRAAHPRTPILLVAGASIDKDVPGIIREILPAADAVLCTRARHHGAPDSLIAQTCEQLRPGSVWRQAPTMQEALPAAIERARNERMLILITGGLFLATEAAAILRGIPPERLRFL